MTSSNYKDVFKGLFFFLCAVLCAVGMVYSAFWVSDQYPTTCSTQTYWSEVRTTWTETHEYLTRTETHYYAALYGHVLEISPEQYGTVLPRGEVFVTERSCSSEFWGGHTDFSADWSSWRQPQT